MRTATHHFTDTCPVMYSSRIAFVAGVAWAIRDVDMTGGAVTSMHPEMSAAVAPGNGEPTRRSGYPGCDVGGARHRLWPTVDRRRAEGMAILEGLLGVTHTLHRRDPGWRRATLKLASDGVGGGGGGGVVGENPPQRRHGERADAEQ